MTDAYVTPLRIAVGIATAGRPQLLGLVLDELAKQSRRPDAVIVCAPEQSDAASAPAGGEVVVVAGPQGLTRQRNEILRRVGGADIVVFFDDDFLPERGYLAVVERVFAERPDVVLMTGLVVADGIGRGCDIEEARQALQAVGGDGALARGEGPLALREVPNGYGCNMAVRLAPTRVHGLRFDENLPLFGWLEDLDFSRQIACCGRLVKALDARGVRLGIERGPQPGRRLGYAQIANPLYLLRKGTCRRRTALRLICRNLAANSLRSLRPEPYIDRFGRMAGNARALADLVSGRLDPQRVSEL